MKDFKDEIAKPRLVRAVRKHGPHRVFLRVRGHLQELRRLEQNKGRDVESYIRIETIRGKPVAYLVREPRIPLSPLPALMRVQAE